MGRGRRATQRIDDCDRNESDAMKTVIFLGKRLAPGSPRAQYPGAELWGVTQSNQRYEKFGHIDDWTSWHDYHPVEPTPFYPGIRLGRPRTYDWYRTLPRPNQAGYRP